MTEQFFGISDTGKQRQNNEDTFIAQQGKHNRFVIAGVIDGVGGYSGGEIAAEQARIAILKRLDKPGDEMLTMLKECFVEANENILKEKQRLLKYENMSCVATLALVDIINNQFYFAHVGDSRLYLLRDQSLIKISHDQSFVGFMEDSGRITEEAAMNHPRRNEINKALGFESDISAKDDYIETGQSPFLSGDLILLCSDGLSDLVPSAEITAILIKNTSLQEKGNQLVAAANAHGGKDNITVVLVKNDKVATQYAATKSNFTEKKNEDAIPGIQKPLNYAKESEVAEKSKKRVNPVNSVLAVICVLLLATSIYLFLQHRKVAPAVPVTQAADHLQPTSNPQEIKLQSAVVNLKGNSLILSDTAYKSPLVISKAIVIDKDTLIIKIKGKLIFQSDPSYKGPAFLLAAKNKSLVLDSLTFQNFNVALSTANNTLELKNVKFINCTKGVVNTTALINGKFINGKLSPLVFKADSLPSIHK